MRVWAALTEKGQELLHQYASCVLSGNGSEGLSGSPGTPHRMELLQPVVDELSLLVPSLLVPFSLPCPGLLSSPTSTYQLVLVYLQGNPGRPCPATYLFPVPVPEPVTLSRNPCRSLAPLKGSCDKEREPAPQWLETCFGALFPKMWHWITQNHLQEKKQTNDRLIVKGRFPVLPGL